MTVQERNSRLFASHCFSVGFNHSATVTHLITVAKKIVFKKYHALGLEYLLLIFQIDIFQGSKQVKHTDLLQKISC